MLRLAAWALLERGGPLCARARPPVRQRTEDRGGVLVGQDGPPFRLDLGLFGLQLHSMLKTGVGTPLNPYLAGLRRLVCGFWPLFLYVN